MGTSLQAQVEQAQLSGTTELGFFGRQVVTLGDIDGDRCDDLAVSEEFYDVTFAANVGRIDVVSGKTATVIRSHVGGARGDQLGAQLAAPGDLNGDGVPDLCVSSWEHDVGTITRAGMVVAFSGATGARLWRTEGQAKDERLGERMVAIHDFDGDGRRDLLVTSHLDVLILGGDGQRLMPLGITDVAGSFAGVGDLDGDDVPDLAVGRESYSGPIGNEGEVRLYSGATGLQFGAFFGASADDAIGATLLHVPDVDGDGVDEILVGGRQRITNAEEGMAQLLSGSTLLPLWTRKGIHHDDELGYRTALAGDWNRDGVCDVAVSVLFGGASNMGSVQLLSGSDGALLHELEGAMTTEEDELEFGNGLAGGDWNGDGIGDVAVGIPSWWEFKSLDTFVGALRLYAGCPAFTEEYGSGFAGTNGVPALAASGSSALGADLTLTADNSLGVDTSGVLLIGTAPASHVLRSGLTLLVDTPHFESLFIPAAGWTLTETIPDDLALCFADFYLQVLELDSGAVGRISATQGLQVRIGFDL